MNFILFQSKFLKFKSKIKFIKFELHNYVCSMSHSLPIVHSVLERHGKFIFYGEVSCFSLH